MNGIRKILRSRASLTSAFCVVLALAFFAQPSSAQQANAEQGGPYTSLIIRGVTVIDGSGAPAYGPVDIYVKGNRIERVVAHGFSFARRRRSNVGRRHRR